MDGPGTGRFRRPRIRSDRRALPEGRPPSPEWGGLPGRKIRSSDFPVRKKPRRRSTAAPLVIPVIVGILAAGCAAFPAGSAAPGGVFDTGSSSLTGAPPESGGTENITWQPVALGIDLAEIVSRRPPLRVYCLRVDTETPGIEVIVTPQEDEAVSGAAVRDRPLPREDEEYPGRRTSTFLEHFGLIAAVNGSPFRPVRLNEGKPTDVVGISISRGRIVSPPEGSYDALVRKSTGDYAVVSQAELPDDIDLALGGFHRVLEEGEPRGAAVVTAGTGTSRTGGPPPVRHPRTGVGISRSGRILYLLVIDGRNPVSSIGATEGELAAWLSYFGARDGLNLDGGGSATLVVADGEGSARIVNHPLGYGRLGMERVVGNHLGVRSPLRNAATHNGPRRRSEGSP